MKSSCQLSTTRSISTSWAALRGVPLDDICAAANCASSCTFAHYYRVSVAVCNPVATAVLPTSSVSSEAQWVLNPRDFVGMSHTLYIISDSQQEWTKTRVMKITVDIWIPCHFWIKACRFWRRQILGARHIYQIAYPTKITYDFVGIRSRPSARDGYPGIILSLMVIQNSKYHSYIRNSCLAACNF